MDVQAFQGLIRHLFTTVGGYFVGAGFVSTNIDLEAVGGAVAVLVGVVWSMYHKKQVAAVS